MRLGPIEISWVPKNRWPVVWTKADRVTKLTVGEMSNAHVRNTLSLILRRSAEGYMWDTNKNGAFRYVSRRTMTSILAKECWDLIDTPSPK